MHHSQHSNGHEISPAGHVGLVLLGILQVAFAFLAAWDLAHRPAEEVRGPKPAWAPALLINWIGPASYFLFGIKR
jgi:Phospholipase_D-nuclease N-terminal